LIYLSLMGVYIVALLYGFLLFTMTATAAPSPILETRQPLTGPRVFAHYLITIQPPNNDYTNDIKLAKAAGIDAFAVNYGGWDCSWPQLEGWLHTFYETAKTLDFKLFVSFDTTIINNTTMIVDLTNTYATHPAQLLIDNKVVLSSFSVDPPAWNWQTAVLNQTTHPTFFLPGTLSQDPASTYASNVGAGPFTWIHPANSIGEEKAIDADFAAHRTSTGRPWMAGIAPWYFKRMSADMNWLHAQDSGMWIERWMNLLHLKPDYIEIITWNDYGESSYIGPAQSTPAAQLAASNTYYAGLDHTAFLAMAKIFIAAYKAGDEKPVIRPADEQVFLYYRLQPAQTNGATDSLPLPKNASEVSNNVFVISFLAQPATITVTTGGQQKALSYPAVVGRGIHAFGTGKVSLSMNRALGSGETLSKSGPDVQGGFDKYQGNVVAI